jgi:DNA replication and repair protein RecF
MYVRQLELTNFRNFRKLNLELAEGPVVFRGDNGQGKSNLLEAVELLAAAKSSRAGTDRELINWAALQVGSLEPFARVRGTIVRGGQDVRGEILVQADAAHSDEGLSTNSLSPGGGSAAGSERPGPLGRGGSPTASKRFRVNGVARRALEFVGTINAVAFSPEDVSLVAGPPSGRRRYLDIMNCQASSRYLYSLQRYQKVLAQRNQLLRQMRTPGGHMGGPTDHDSGGRTLAVWSEQLSAEGAFLLLERTHAISELAELAARWFCELSGMPQHLKLEYHSSVLQESVETPRAPQSSIPVEPSIELSLEEVHRRFMAALERMEPRERGAGVSLVGPHRDDFRFSLDGWDLHMYGSRGQQRLAALALKLGEADLLERRAGSRPILLLDDVLSELDRKRQQAVLRFIASRGQSLVTVTSLDGIDWDELPCAPVFDVDQGTVSPGDALGHL